MPTLVDALFSLLVTTAGARSLAAPARRALERAAEQEWARALDLLSLHKVFPLLCHRLEQESLLSGLPESARERLRAARAEVKSRNTFLLLTLARLLRIAETRGESWLILKGILFCDAYYPDPSTRPMSDLDLVAAPGRGDAQLALLEEAGFRRSLHHVVQDHSVTLMNREGVFCDAHRSLPLFSDEPWETLTREVQLQRVRGVRARELEPNAMVAHLAAHMAGHSADIGFVLLWLVDLALVLARYERELDPSRIRKLVRHEAPWALLLRLVRLIERAGGPAVPALAGLGSMLPPLTLGGVLRQRRIRPWGIPGPIGWARYGAHQLGLHPSERPLPRWPDLLLWPVDELAARVSPSIARRTLP